MLFCSKQLTYYIKIDVYQLILTQDSENMVNNLTLSRTLTIQKYLFCLFQ